MSSTSIFTLAQEISVSIKPEKIRVGGALQITVSIQNEQIKKMFLLEKVLIQH